MKTISLLVLVMLVGCATTDNAIQSSVDNANAMCNAALASSKFDPLREKVAFSPKEVSIQKLNISSYPSDVEKPLILALGEERWLCAQDKVSIAKHHGLQGVAAAIDQASHEEREAIASLYGGKITYGDYNRSVSKVGVSAQKNIAEANATQASIDAQQEAASAQRAAAAMQTIQTIQRQRPVNCTTTGAYGAYNTSCH
jgi:hypothetical protein